jgi:hypothetical protein
MPEVGEDVYFEADRVTLMKELAQRDFSGGYGGVSFRVAKGVRVSTGRFAGHSVQTHTKLTPVDTGPLAVTSHRTIFTGARTTLVLPHEKLVGLNIYADGILIHTSQRQTPVLLTGFHGQVIAAYINAAAQREAARQAAGGSDEHVLIEVAHRLDERVEAQPRAACPSTSRRSSSRRQFAPGYGRRRCVNTSGPTHNGVPRNSKRRRMHLRRLPSKTPESPLRPMVALASSLIGASRAVRPARTGGEMFRYRLQSPDGDDLGEATYAQMIHAGEEIHIDGGRRFRVLDAVIFDDEDSPFTGQLQVEPA